MAYRKGGARTRRSYGSRRPSRARSGYGARRAPARRRAPTRRVARRSAPQRAMKLQIEVVQPSILQRPDLGIAAAEAPRPKKAKF